MVGSISNSGTSVQGTSPTKWISDTILAFKIEKIVILGKLNYCTPSSCTINMPKAVPNVVHLKNLILALSTRLVSLQATNVIAWI